MERQSHGFKFEQYIKEKYNVCLFDEYTSKWDGVLNNIPVSIKCEKLGSDIELADYFRNSDIQDDFYLIVGFWDKNKDNIVEEKILLIKGEEFHSLFNEKMSLKFKELITSISNDHSDDEKWKNSIKELKTEWKSLTPNLIRPRFKRDHKTQKRIQCAINNKDFYSYFVTKYEIK